MGGVPPSPTLCVSLEATPSYLISAEYIDMHSMTNAEIYDESTLDVQNVEHSYIPNKIWPDIQD